VFRKFLKIVALPALFGISACSDDNTSGVTVEDNAIARNESSSSNALSSSSSILSSSSNVPSSDKNTAGNTVLWNWTLGTAKINTGSENSGFWYTWSDDEMGGTSSVVFPVEMGNEYSENMYDPVIESCEGFCGTVKFGKTSDPEAGIGFSVAEEGESVDISSWGGLCLTYSSSVAFTMFLVSELGDKSDMDSYPRIYMQSLKQGDEFATSNFFGSETPVTRCAKWSDFTVYKNDEVERRGDEDAQKAKAIVFKFSGPSGTSVNFNIKSIGTFDERLPHVYDGDPDKFYNGVRITDADSATCVWKGVLYERYQTENAAGTWITYGDDIGSKIVYPIDLGYYSWQSVWGMDPLLDYCGGFCGTMALDHHGSSEDAFLGVGYVLAGREKREGCAEDEECFGEVKTADIENWGGICITYYSPKEAYLRLRIDTTYFEDPEASEFPIVGIPEARTMAEKCFKWSDFDNLTSDKLKKVSAIAFEIRTQTIAENVNFNVAAIGKYSAQGACSLKASTEPYVLPESSASVVPAESSSSMSSSKVSSSSWYFQDECGFKEVDDLWYGADGIWRVETYLGDDTETSGYWFGIEDHSSAENSKIIWPVQIGDEYNPEAKWPVVEYCSGICATIDFRNEYFAGVGFNVRGVSEGGEVAMADATEWGGMCVTYVSESDIDIVMSSSGRDDFYGLSLLPKATLPKSSSVVTKCVDWKAFKSVNGQKGDPSNLGSIYFVINGEAKSKSKFNILGLGKYKELSESMSECQDKDGFVIAD